MVMSGERWGRNEFCGQVHRLALMRNKSTHAQDLVDLESSYPVRTAENVNASWHAFRHRKQASNITPTWGPRVLAT